MPKKTTRNWNNPRAKEALGILVMIASLAAVVALWTYSGADPTWFKRNDPASGPARNGLGALSASRSERVAVYLEKRFEAVIACFGAAAAGCVFVPVNPLLKPKQVAYILAHCNVRVLITSDQRLKRPSSQIWRSEASFVPGEG